MAALAQDIFFRVIENFDVLGFEDEEAGDPFFVEGAEGRSIIPCPKRADLDPWHCGKVQFACGALGSRHLGTSWNNSRSHTS